MKVHPRSRKYISEYANKIRAIFNVAPDKKVNVVKVFERVLEALNIKLLIVEDSELRNQYAVYSPQKKAIEIRNSVYVGACNNDCRDRLTLAHEIGHILLHSNEAVLTRSFEKVPVYCDPEWQAFEFARDFLCPIEQITFNENEYDLSDRYGISYQAAGIQISNKNKTKK